MTLKEITTELFRDASREGRKDRSEALMADAMVEMARRARGVFPEGCDETDVHRTDPSRLERLGERSYPER